jgi:hypothetical protein
VGPAVRPPQLKARLPPHLRRAGGGAAFASARERGLHDSTWALLGSPASSPAPSDAARLGRWAGRERMHLYYHVGEDGKRVYTLKKKDPEGKVRLGAPRALCVCVRKGVARLLLLASVRAVCALAARCGAP